MRNTVINVLGENMLISQAVKKYGVPYALIYNRYICLHWSGEEAVGLEEHHETRAANARLNINGKDYKIREICNRFRVPTSYVYARIRSGTWTPYEIVELMPRICGRKMKFPVQLTPYVEIIQCVNTEIGKEVYTCIIDDPCSDMQEVRYLTMPEMTKLWEDYYEEIVLRINDPSFQICRYKYYLR